MWAAFYNDLVVYLTLNIISASQYLHYKDQYCVGKFSHSSLQSMAQLDEISRVQRHFSPLFVLIFLIYLARALAILCKLVHTEVMYLSVNIVSVFLYLHYKDQYCVGKFSH